MPSAADLLSREKGLLVCVLLAAVTAAVYWPVSDFGFVHFDDDGYVEYNRYVHAGITPESIAWAFTTTEMANWHPLTWLSLMADCQIAGPSPGQFHLTNVLMHVACAILLFLVLQRATRRTWPSAFVAALFALHPLHVQSVAWVSERKDVLSALFWMLAMWLYLDYVERPTGRRLALVVAAMGLGLLAKPMLVTLPLVLLIFGWWPLRRSGMWSSPSPQPSPARGEGEGKGPSPARGEGEGNEPSPVGGEGEGNEPSPARGEGEGYEPSPARGEGEGKGPSSARGEGEGYEPSPAGGEGEGKGPSSAGGEGASGPSAPASAATLRSATEATVAGSVVSGHPCPETPFPSRLFDSAALRLSTPLLPLFALAAVSCVVTFIVQRQGGAVGTFAEFPLGVRLANAAVAYCAYLLKTVWPADLAVLYPHPGASLPVWQVAGSVLTLTLISAVVFHQRQRRPYLLAGWLWYVITLLPVIGLVQIGDHSMADRYTYIPLIGVFFAVSWTATELATKSHAARGRLVTLAVAAIAVMAALTVRTSREISYWRDGTTLFSRALQVTTGNFVMHNNLGNELFGDDADGAKKQFELALRIKPDYPPALQNLGALLLRQGRANEAIGPLRRAAKLDPASFSARANLGSALMLEGDLDGAIAAFGEALKLRPEDSEIRAKLDEARELRRHCP